MSIPEASTVASVDEAIDALGGTGAVARLTGRKVQAVSNWRARGAFPSDTYVVLGDALRTLELVAPPALWGMATAEPAEART